MYLVSVACYHVSNERNMYSSCITCSLCKYVCTFKPNKPVTRFVLIVFQLYPSLSTYPAVGALEDTKDYVETFIDPDYTLHITMTKVLADLILRLSDSAILPYDLDSLIKTVQRGKTILYQMTSLLHTMSIEIGKISVKQVFITAYEIGYNKLSLP